MKRIVCSFVIILLLCSCSEKNRFIIDTDSFNTPFQAKINGEEYRGHLSFDSGQNMIITLIYPENIDGYTITFCGDTVISSFDNVENYHNINEYSDGFLFLSLYNILKKSVSDGQFSKSSGSSFEMQYNGNSLVADADGRITSAKINKDYFIFG